MASTTAAADGPTAFLVMDLLPQILSHLPEQTKSAYLLRVAETLSAVRSKRETHPGLPVTVIHVTTGFRSGYPEMNTRNKGLSWVIGSDTFTAEAHGTSGLNARAAAPLPLDSAVAPAGDEIVIVKKRYSSFAGSDLDMILRSQGITHLVLAGMSTSGVVLSTAREAADKDFKVTVLKDLCVYGDDEVHRVLTEKVFPMAANVVDSGGWLESLGA